MLFWAASRDQLPGAVLQPRVISKLRQIGSRTVADCALLIVTAAKIHSIYNKYFILLFFFLLFSLEQRRCIYELVRLLRRGIFGSRYLFVYFFLLLLIARLWFFFVVFFRGFNFYGFSCCFGPSLLTVQFPDKFTLTATLSAPV